MGLLVCSVTRQQACLPLVRCPLTSAVSINVIPDDISASYASLLASLPYSLPYPLLQRNGRAERCCTAQGNIAWWPPSRLRPAASHINTACWGAHARTSSLSGHPKTRLQCPSPERRDHCGPAVQYPPQQVPLALRSLARLHLHKGGVRCTCGASVTHTPVGCSSALNGAARGKKDGALCLI